MTKVIFYFLIVVSTFIGYQVKMKLSAQDVLDIQQRLDSGHSIAFQELNAYIAMEDLRQSIMILNENPALYVDEDGIDHGGNHEFRGHALKM